MTAPVIFVLHASNDSRQPMSLLLAIHSSNDSYQPMSLPHIVHVNNDSIHVNPCLYYLYYVSIMTHEALFHCTWSTIQEMILDSLRVSYESCQPMALLHFLHLSNDSYQHMYLLVLHAGSVLTTTSFLKFRMSSLI